MSSEVKFTDKVVQPQNSLATFRKFKFATPASKIEYKVYEFDQTKATNSQYGTPTGDIVWAGSFVFAYHMLLSMSSEFEGKKLLELGSGCGLTSMAALSCNLNATFTDIGSALSHLHNNLELNGWTNCKLQPLDWFQPDKLCEKGSYEVILGCEVVYHEPLTQPLVNTIDYHLAPGGLVYLISAQHRHCYLYMFHLLLTLGYTVKYTRKLEPPNADQASFTPAQELTVAWFSEGEFEHDMNNIILICFQKA